MRIAALHLKTYGPFDGAVLDLGAGTAGLQVVYGPNERGKSTALRAIDALLFGFPARTEDHFGRDYGALRVGAVVDDGVRRLALMRRKGNRNTLYEFDPASGDERPDRPLDQAVVDVMLGGVDARRFSMMYGLGAESLRRGGRALLDSGSELGATLFEAASGVSRLRAVSASLQADAEALFVPRGRNPRLNATLGELDARQEAARAAGVRPRDWQVHRDALQRADAEVLRLETALREQRARLAHVERLLGLGPQVARLGLLARAGARLAEAPLLPQDAGEQLAALRGALEQARVALADGQDRIARHREALAALAVSQAHLDAAPGIAQLAGRLDEFEAARVSVAGLQADWQAAGTALRRGLDAIDPEAARDPAATAHAARATGWLPSRATVTEARQQLAARRALETRRVDALDAVSRAAQASIEARHALRDAGEPRDLSGLDAAHDASVAAGDLEHRVASLQARLAVADAQLARQASALGADSPEALARAGSLPAAELDRVLADAQARLTERAALQARRAEPADTLPRLREQLAGLSRERAVVDRDRLLAARAERDAALGRLAADPGGPPAPTALDAVARAIGETDRLADARFDDASRLAAIESLSQRIAQLEAALAGFDDDARRLRGDAERAAAEWSQRLAGRGLPALDPPAFREWSIERLRFLDALRARDTLAAEREAAAIDLERHLALLRAAYRSAGLESPALPTLAALLAHARVLIEAAQRAAAERARRQAEADRVERDLERRRAALEGIERELGLLAPGWTRIAVALRLEPSATPAALESRLDAFDGLREALAASELAARRLQAATGIIALFEADAGALARRLSAAAPEPGTESAFVAGCRAALADAERARDRRLRLQAEIEALEASVAAAGRRRDEALAGIAMLQERAGAVDLPALQEAVARSEQRRDTERQAQALEAMVRASTGAAHDALVAEAAAADVAVLQAEQAGLAQSIAYDEAARDHALGERTRAQAAFDAIDGGGAAAHAVEAVHERMAASARLATDWARLRLARELLEQAVQRHQQRAQGPLLAAAARWFSRLTAGRWRDLRPDWSGDTQVLLAERDDGARVPIDALSEGTADALYLALRLAAIDVRLASAPPVPLLLDDVLMTFDDERAGLALQGLAELGRRNQVVYFTHHRHLVDLARRALPPGSVAVQTLQRGPLADASPDTAASPASPASPAPTAPAPSA
jgi:exonuclease SbcC